MHHLSIKKYGENQKYKNYGWELLEVFMGDDGKLYLVSEGGEVYDKIPDGKTEPIDVINDFAEVMENE